MMDARPNKFKAWCSLCRAEIAEGVGLMVQRDVPKEDGTTEKKWITDCKDVEACHERIRAAVRKRSAAAKERKQKQQSTNVPWQDTRTGRFRTR